VTPDVDAEIAKEAVAVDVIKVLFGVDDTELVGWTRRDRVAVKSGRRRVCTGIDDQRGVTAND
jgi:hypothetical protein